MTVSSDGFVNATIDSPWSSVDIVIDWKTSSPEPWQTTVTRTTPDGATVTVRSGDLMYTPGGDGYAYDHEAPLGVACTYKAYGYDPNGALLRTSTTATVTNGTVPAHMVWVKSLANPSLSLQLVVGSLAAPRARPQTIFGIPGRSNPVIWEDVLSGRKGTLTVVSLTAAQRTGLRALLVAGGPALIQFDPSVAVADMFVSFAGDTETPVGPRQIAASTWPLAFTERDRPVTAGSPLRVPLWTNDIVAATYASFDVWDASFGSSYVNQAKGP